MKTAVIQMNSSSDKRRNIEKALSFVHAAAGRGARFILLPEVFNGRTFIKTTRDLSAMAEAIPGGSLRPFLEAAQKFKVFILAGSIYEKAPQKAKVYNTSTLISPQGKIIAKYRKMHLFDAVLNKKSIRESAYFLPGEKAVVSRAGEFNLGMTICYDLRFPELYRACARLGAHVLCVPSSFTKITGEVHWEVLLKARAIENLCYVLAPNQIGRDAKGIEAFGHSMIVNPWGEIAAEASGDREEILFAEISLKEIQKARQILPAAGCSRFDITSKRMG